MSNTSTYPLRLPKSLKAELAKAAKRDHTSINQFISLAVAEKLSVLETQQFFETRAEKSDRASFRTLLHRSGGEPPKTGDKRP